MQATKVVNLVYDWAIRPERLADTLAAADVQGRHLLALVYAAEERGATEAELIGSLDGFPPSQALLLLGRLEQEVLLYSREGEKSRTYHGFRDLAETVLAASLTELAAGDAGSEAAAWISYRQFLLSHLCHFLAQIALGAAKITQGGELHRKDAQELANRFAFGERLSDALAGDEVQFLLHFAVAGGLALQEGGTLYLSPEGKAFLRLNRQEAWDRLADWWLRNRLRGLSQVLAAFSTLPAEAAAFRVAPWANLLWIHSGTYRKTYGDLKSSFTWENLPKALQELWMLGLADFGMTKGRIAWIRPDRAAMARAAGKAPAAPSGTPSSPDAAPSGTGASASAPSETGALAAVPSGTGGSDPAPSGMGASASAPFGTGAEVRPISLANLESLVPLEAPLTRLAQLELVGLKSNDEFMGRWRFTKESVIKGLQAGLSLDDFRDLLAWLGFEAHARRALLDWASTYSSTLFLDTLVLKVSDPVRFEELREIPQFLELVTEVIPGYGFTLHRQNKPRVRELLHHFGLVPGEDALRSLELVPVILAGAAQTWEFARPESGPALYRESAGNLRAPQPLPQDKDSVAAREQDMATKLAALEGAIAEGKKVEFSYSAPTLKRISLKPLLILKHKDPPKVIGIEAESGHRNEYVLEQMKALRVLE